MGRNGTRGVRGRPNHQVQPGATSGCLSRTRLGSKDTALNHMSIRSLFSLTSSGFTLTFTNCHDTDWGFPLPYTQTPLACVAHRSLAVTIYLPSIHGRVAAARVPMQYALFNHDQSGMTNPACPTRPSCLPFLYFTFIGKRVWAGGSSLFNDHWRNALDICKLLSITCRNTPGCRAN